MFSGDWEDNKAVVKFFEDKTADIAEKVKSIKAAAVQAQINSLQAELEGMDFM